MYGTKMITYVHVQLLHVILGFFKLQHERDREGRRLSIIYRAICLLVIQSWFQETLIIIIIILLHKYIKLD